MSELASSMHVKFLLIGRGDIKGQFHVRDLFLGKLNSYNDFAERLLNPLFKSISRA